MRETQRHNRPTVLLRSLPEVDGRSVYRVQSFPSSVRYRGPWRVFLLEEETGDEGALLIT